MSAPDIFTQIRWVARRGQWMTDARTGDEWNALPAASLVGHMVNLGDKDGWVYEGATVTAFDEATGDLTLEHGINGPSFRPDYAEPLERPAVVSAHDVARGVFCK